MSDEFARRALFMAAVAAAALVGLIGCSQLASQPAANYFPRENGYSWVYKDSFITSGEVEITSETETRKVDGTTLLPSGLTAINFVSSSEWAVSATTYYYVDGAGVYHYGTAAHPTTEAQQILAFPLEAGKVWTRSGSMICEAIGAEDVTVPAGTFRAMKVLVGGTDYYEWYADGVGLVKGQISLMIATLEAGTGRFIPTEGFYIVQLTSKNF